MGVAAQQEKLEAATLASFFSGARAKATTVQSVAVGSFTAVERKIPLHALPSIAVNTAAAIPLSNPRLFEQRTHLQPSRSSVTKR